VISGEVVYSHIYKDP